MIIVYGPTSSPYDRLTGATTVGDTHIEMAFSSYIIHIRETVSTPVLLITFIPFVLVCAWTTLNEFVFCMGQFYGDAPIPCSYTIVLPHSTSGLGSPSSMHISVFCESILQKINASEQTDVLKCETNSLTIQIQLHRHNILSTG